MEPIGRRRRAPGSVRRARRGALAAGGLVLASLIAGCSEERERVEVPRVVVPNGVIADLVQRVSCVEDIDVTIGDDGATTPPVLVLTLDATAPTPDGDGPLVLSVPALTTTIDRPGGPDVWVWTDPIRFAELSQGVAGALSLSGRFDAALLDRCVARIDAQMEQLDLELYAATQEVPDLDRTMDLSLPGTLYFANRYEFTTGDSEADLDVGRIISVDDLGEAASYDEMMRANVEQVVEVLRARR